MEKNYELVQKAISGDIQAFDSLLRNKQDKLYRTAFLYVKNKEDALDIVQETIYIAFVSINQVRQPEYFDTWLVRVLIRVATSFLKARNTLVLNNEIGEKLESCVDIEKSSNDKIYVVDAINNLKLDHRTVIILYYYHDLSIKDISEIVEKPENTIKSDLRRAKLELKDLFLKEENNHE